MRRRPDPGARWRAASAALLTAALAISGHALAAHAVPSGTAVALLTVLAATVGVMAGTSPRGRAGLAAMLTAGQVVGHLVLATGDHVHGSDGLPALAMLCAHAVAVVVGALLLAAADRLCAALSTAVRALIGHLPLPVGGAPSSATVSDQPLQSMLLLVASVSHRGPPVSLLR